MNKKVIIAILLTLLTAYVSVDYDVLTSIFTFILYYGMCLSGEWIIGKLVPKKKEEKDDESK